MIAVVHRTLLERLLQRNVFLTGEECLAEPISDPFQRDVGFPSLAAIGIVVELVCRNDRAVSARSPEGFATPFVVASISRVITHSSERSRRSVADRFLGQVDGVARCTSEYGN